MNAEQKTKLQFLKSEIAKHDLLYYQKAQPEISDYAYDLLKKELLHLERLQNLSTITNNSVTDTVGDDRIEGFIKRPHRQPMLSLDNTYNQEELREFDKRLQKALKEDLLEYVIEPKIDGVAISLIYENGSLIYGITRGNGVEGDDITHNLKTIPELPLVLKGAGHPKFIEIRGEVYMTIRELQRINTLREEKGLTAYANPRNLAAGTVKLLDARETADRKLAVVLYGIGLVEGFALQNQADCRSLFQSWGLPVLEKQWIASGFESVWQKVELLEKDRHEFQYQTDGAVIKLNKLESQEIVGFTGKAPRWAIAYKFEPEQAITQLKKISIQVGRTGVLTPVAELEPIELAGTVVSRATLHNEDEIRRKDIREGDWVIVEKAGEIIPCVVSVVMERRPIESTSYSFPTVCPTCQTSVIRLPKEVAWRCTNVSCSSQTSKRIQHFVSKYAMDIDNLGEAVVNQLLAKGCIQTIADLYVLKKEDLLQLEKFAEKSSQNLIDSIQASKGKDLWRLIHGLGIPNIGVQTAKDLAHHFQNLDNLIQASADALIEVEGIGDVVAQSIVAFFQAPSNQLLIKRLIEYGLNTIVHLNVSDVPLFFKGKTVAITGTLPTLTREEAKTWIESSGGKITNTINKKTSYVLVGANAGSKLKKAQELKITIIDEVQLRELLNIIN
jgi:DNA ligase (NAD+)